MMEDDFYSTIKLKNGEEIFARVSATEEYDKTLLIISNPIIITEIKSKEGVVGYKIEPWLKTTKEDMFILNMEDILTMTENDDIEIISLYQKFVNNECRNKRNETKISRRMGYLSNVNDAKEILEKIFDNS
jgi:hypothetical protein